MKLSQILGVIFLLAGVALAALCFVMPGSMQAIGVTQEVAAILLVGGGICLSLGSTQGAVHTDYVETRPVAPAIDDPRRMPAPPPERPRPPEPPAAPEARPSLKSFGKGPAAAVAATEAVKETVEAARPSVAETIQALEQAKSDIASALSIEKAAPAVEPRPTIASVMEKPLGEIPKQEPPAVLVMPPPPPPPPPPVAEEVEEADDPDLYVVEEKVIRGRPARVLSDGTVEAETDEGWMRFENLEHLDEYLDAMSPGS